MSDEKPWMDAERVYELYHEQGMTIREVADELDCSHGSVRNGMKANDISPRGMGPRPDEKLTDREWLAEQYHEKKLSMQQIADKLDVSVGSVSYHMKKHGIERRDQGVASGMSTKRGPAYHGYKPTGYEIWQTSDGGQMRTIFVHRLIMVAEHGVGAVAEMDVHHKNGVPWDNRPENLELIGHGEHARHHRLEESQ